MEYQIFLAGVGGQGILSVTDIICNAAVDMGFKVHGSETHGMSQRGGSVFSNVRFGDVYSPLIMERDSDIILAFEPTEALRYAHFIKPNGIFLVNIHPIPSPSFILTKSSYPEIESIISALKNFSSNIIAFNATKLASNLGMPIVQNIVMLGALSVVPELPLSVDSLKTALKKQFRAKHFKLNLQAFEVGRQAYENNPP
ncbi:MAG: indolepyruvate oxidoreductase subunit beta [Candidatus Heimdallarchaeota archaeon]|nr:MAG: indolepyruvate oxidoreductase subunit beta [Candidatus Heimdallarchaeota archaeon]